MSFEAAKAHLEQYGLADRVIVFDQSSATVAMAAQAAGTSEAEIAKTLSFLVDDAAVLIVAAGDTKVNSSKFKAKFHTKAKMVPADRVEELVGHAPGGGVPLCRAYRCARVFGRVSPPFRIRLPRMRKLQQRRAPYARGTRARIRLCWVGRRVQAARNGAVTASMFKKIG